MGKSIGDQKTLGSDPEVPGGGYALGTGDLLGQYRIIRPLGRGGMGEVYEVEHTTLGLRYALKLLPSDFINSPNALDRFRREARVMANLNHPNIVKVDDFGETDGRYWLRMELADGISGTAEQGISNNEPQKDVNQSAIGNRQSAMLVTLADLAKTHGGKISQETLLPILKQVLQALDYAHGHGAVHRDLKPSNILLKGSFKSLKPLKSLKSEDGLNEAVGRFNEHGDSTPLTAMISDFGLVKLVGEEWLQSMVQLSVQRSMSIGEEKTAGGTAASPSEGSSTRSMLGTYEYMSPEQKRGEEADARSDIYSVGLMIYKLLTGRELGMRTPSQIDPSLDKGWDAVVLQALEENPEDRFRSVEEMVAAIPSRKDLGPETLGFGNTEDRYRAESVAINNFAKQNSDARNGSSTRKSAKEDEPQPAATRTPDPVRQQRDPAAGNMLGMAFVEVKAGSFMMGSIHWESDEKPVRRVEITRDFWMGKFEVTNGEYQRFVKESGYDGRKDADSGYLTHFGSGSDMPTDDRHPVVWVSWNNAVKFCEWMTQRERQAGRLPAGLVYRLPTEAEWEYAARGGHRETETTYAGGNDINAVAWHGGNSQGKTQRVGTKAANELGLHDMSGNVWEWVHDWYQNSQNSYSGLGTTDPSGPSSGSSRVIRGGSWSFGDSFCRVAGRGYGAPTYADSCDGFRVVVAAPVQ